MKAVFLDRDGVINENRPDHVKTWQEFCFLPGAVDAIARLTQAGVRVFVITNQAVINRGLVSQESVDAINRQMTEEIERAGGTIEAIAYCPHRPDEQCGCRKPEPGLLISLGETHGLDLRDAAVIGDALTDMQAGLSAGCRAILVLTGRGQKQATMAATAGNSGFAIAPDLNAAADLVLGQIPASAH